MTLDGARTRGQLRTTITQKKRFKKHIFIQIIRLRLSIASTESQGGVCVTAPKGGSTVKNKQFNDERINWCSNHGIVLDKIIDIKYYCVSCAILNLNWIFVCTCVSMWARTCLFPSEQRSGDYGIDWREKARVHMVSFICISFKLIRMVSLFYLNCLEQWQHYKLKHNTQSTCKKHARK